jgi:ectoine hydroxylase-related dioxygenase (phytanoyl-CoA dioxygenase family)
LTICVAARVDIPGYGAWTRKVGVHHVQPPVRVLDGMLSVRIHLDDCEETNGALRVLPGTHTLGRLTAKQIAEEARSREYATCEARAGDVLLMRPLLVHASSAASRAAHRRVIHIDYAACQLDDGLRWLAP